MHYRAITWDHPRGYHALAAAAARLDEVRDGLTIEWDKQPLEGFEAHPIEDLCARYDLVVLDHPHVGEAVAANCLRPLEALLGEDELTALAGATIGPSLASYRYQGSHWALPLDAATQVMAYRGDLLGDTRPVTWDDVRGLRQPVALSLAGPHAALSFQSIATAFGDPPAEADPERFVGEAAGAYALDLMADLAARTPDAVRGFNPIGLLAHMAATEAVALCPLVYGYVNYAAPRSGKALAFADAPRAKPGGRPGSTLGGTGIGISARAQITPALLDHLRWLMSAHAQEVFIPAHDGQPSLRSAWHNDAVNVRWGNFYRNTADSLERAFVRPRHPRAIAFQTAASALIRDGLADGRPHRAILVALQDTYSRSRTPGTER
jgi:multiple sugar transport system substrate-binding protein